jgi:hypothetical protein
MCPGEAEVYMKTDKAVVIKRVNFGVFLGVTLFRTTLF